MNDSKKLWLSIDAQTQCEPVELGRYASDIYLSDPRHLAFVASRYKFVAKIFDGMNSVMEVGIGDGFGTPLVASAVKRVVGIDINAPLIEDTRRRHARFPNISYEYFDIREKPYSPLVNAAYLVDVIEHIYAEEEDRFMTNISRSLEKRGVVLIGTPNKSAEQFASELSRISHVNLKTHRTLRELGERYFQNVFMFGMNDEVVHTGFGPMCQFLWALCVAPRR